MPRQPAASALPLLVTLALAVGTARAEGPPPAAAPAAQDSAATVTRLDGTLTARRPDGTERLLAVGSAVRQGEVLSTSQESYARLRFRDATDITMRPRTNIRVDTFRFKTEKPEEDNFVLTMLRGGLRAITGLIGARDKSRVAYKTLTATIGIRGTRFGAVLCQPDKETGGNDCDDIRRESGKKIADGLYLDVSEGAISVKSKGGELVIASGEFGYVRDTQAAPVMVPKPEAVPFTAPPAISTGTGTGRTLDETHSNNQCVVN